jgi:hypothetical protein
MNTSDDVTREIKRLQDRCQKRNAANRADEKEIYRLQCALERLTAKELLGQAVLLNPNSNIREPSLRAMRGATAMVERIGRKFALIRFENGDRWRVGFHLIVAATPNNMASDDGSVLDDLADMMNGAFGK